MNKTPAPFSYQQEAARMIVSLPGAALFADPGMGKTRAVLMAFKFLKALNPLFCGLVVAPLRPLYDTWPEEIETWAPGLTWSMVHGTPKQKAAALKADADVYLINPEGLPWLRKQVNHIAFSYIAFDESTKYKGHGTLWRAAKAIAAESSKTCILSGTPVPNNYTEIFPQIYLIDREVLGENLEQFRGTYCKQIGRKEWNQWEVREDAEEKILEAIKDIALRLDANDYRDLPPLIINDIKLKLPKKLMKQYKKLEKEMLLELEGLDTVPAWNQMQKYHFVRQFASGIVKHEDASVPMFKVIFGDVHDLKQKALIELLDTLGGKPLMIGYHYQSELLAIEEAVKGLACGFIGRGSKDVREVVKQWNTNKLQVLVCQIKSASLGLNLHKGKGRDICLYGQTDSPEDHRQFIGRIFGRTGVEEPVRVHRLVMKGTVEEVINKRLKKKGKAQDALLDALKQYHKEGK